MNDISINELEIINGGFTKKDALGVFGSACYVGGVVLTATTGGVGLVLLGTGLVAFDAMG